MTGYRWKIVTSSYIRCDAADGIDLAEEACKPRMNVHAVCNVGSFCTGWATACYTSIQCCGLDDQGIFYQFLAGSSFLSFAVSIYFLVILFCCNGYGLAEV